MTQHWKTCPFYRTHDQSGCNSKRMYEEGLGPASRCKTCPYNKSLQNNLGGGAITKNLHDRRY